MKQQKTVESRVLEILKECPMSRYDVTKITAQSKQVTGLPPNSECRVDGAWESDYPR